MSSSPRNMVISICLAALVTFSNALAIPATDSCKVPTSTPVVPLTSDLSATPLPSTNLTLSYVAIGRGIQNYTCASVGAGATALGAVATLFDATALAYRDEAALHAIPPMFVNVPLPKASFPTAAGILNVLGHHYFDATGTPTFDLSTVGKILYGAKTGDVKAPSTANKGPAGTGAVDWLQLTRKASYTSVGEQVVYRVETAGGVGPVCTDTKPFSVQYAAEYWFFN